MRIRTVTALAVAMAALAGGCSEDDRDDRGGGTRPLPCVPAARQTPLLELESLDGSVYDIKDDLCEQMVVVHFSATWCTTCNQGLPYVQGLHEKYGAEGLRVVAVNVGEEIKRVRQYFATAPVTFPVLLDPFGAYATFWDVGTIPTFVLVSREGAEVFRLVGYDEKRLATLEDEVLARLNAE